jgi:hypothetical protein
MQHLRWYPAACFAVCLAAGLPAVRADAPAPPKVAVIVGPSAGQLECYAAGQLCDYLTKLYGIKVRPVTALPKAAEIGLLVGSPTTNPAVAKTLGAGGWPKVSDQGLVLKRGRLDGKLALVVGGGSPRATMWAVFELIERWGVRYLVHGDVLPQRPDPFRLPDKDVTLEPNLTVRQWRVVNAHAIGPESWGMADYRPVLDQLAKLKFNRLFIYIWPWQPFVHFEAGGIRRKSATMWMGFHYPITDDMPGRRLFGKETEFWNPDLPRGASYDKLSAAGQRLIHNLMAYGRQRGMQSIIVANLGEFPPEFAPLLKNAQKVIQAGELNTVVPGNKTAVTDAGLNKLAAAVLRATVDTYPEADFVELGMQEFRQWVAQYEKSWKALDAKYGIEKIRPLREVLAAAGRRTGYPGGAARALQEVKGDIVVLHFFDRLLNEQKVLKGSRRPDVRFLYDSIAEELFPVLARIVPRGSETLNHVDYTASRILRRREVLKNIPARQIPSTLIYTLHDDNVGVLPQLATGSLHELTQDLRRYGWAGFSTRYWQLGDHEPCVAYLARAAWDKTTTPDAVYRDQVRTACGKAAVKDMLTVFRGVEATTVALEDHALGLTFPVPGMIMQHWQAKPLSADLAADRRGYRRALEAARRALGKTRAAGRPYVDYWVGRLQFGIGYLDTVEAVRNAALAESAGKRADALRHAETALARARTALEAQARVARDRSDHGAIAVMAEYVYRPLKAKVAALKKK